MLKSLEIQNYALIDSLHIEFNRGFSIITGETGAGKSIILGALSLILGQRAESRFIKHNEQKCTIEGVFNISMYDLKSIFDQHDWEYDPETCIIRREIWTNGKSRAFINDSPVYLSGLKELGDRLIDIHSQHQNLSLNDNFYQLNVLDVLAQSNKEKESFKNIFRNFQSVANTLKEMRDDARRNKEEQDYLQFQLDALQEAHLKIGEQEELELEIETITHAEEIKSALYKVINNLSGHEDSIESTLRSSIDTLRGIQKVFASASELAQRLESAYLELKDVRLESESQFESIDFNPDRQQIIEDRLSLIYELQKKHSVQTVEDLLQIQNQLDEQLQQITSLDEEIEKLEKEFLLVSKEMHHSAKILTEKRKSAIADLENDLKKTLSYLGIQNAQFKVNLSAKQQPDINGADHVEFLFSANKNNPPQPIAQIASGGEISRLMLAIKSMMAGVVALPTIIFDEIDTGTSGEIADKMGEIMRQMGAKMQVVAISHLPQIAAKGNEHFHVYKEDQEHSTQTFMRKLTADERVHEIARMLSGAETTSQAVENAKVMLSENTKSLENSKSEK